MIETVRPSQRIRDCLQTHCDVRNKGGKASLYYLSIGNQFCCTDFIDDLCDELDRMPTRSDLGQPPTKLEQFAYQMLAIGCFAASDDAFTKTFWS